MTAKRAKGVQPEKYQRVVTALAISNLLSIVLFVLRVMDAQDLRYWFLLWNLILAWFGPLVAWWLVLRLKHSHWLSWSNLAITVLWLGFLPNSFYLVSDLIHLQPTGEVSLLYDTVMFVSFVFNAYVVGFLSLYLVHRELLKRVNRLKAHSIVAGVIFACSFAIYLGRILRWNTWDVLVNPAGVLFDVSDRLINPAAHPQAVVTTVTFFLLIGTMYMVVWQLIQTLRAEPN